MTRDELKIRTQQAIDAIRVFKEKDYGWSEMEKMLKEILIELDGSDLQTGAPTDFIRSLVQNLERCSDKVHELSQAYMSDDLYEVHVDLAECIESMRIVFGKEAAGVYDPLHSD